MPNRGHHSGSSSSPFANLAGSRIARRFTSRPSGFILAAALIAAIAAMAPAPAAAQTPMTAQVSSPLSAGSIHKGDIVTLQVTSPAAFQGDTIQGKVTQASSSHGGSELQITFDSLRHAGIVVAVETSIQSISNSKGQAGVDEQGISLNATTVAGKAASHGSRWGSNLGGLIGGTSGEVVGDASDAASTKETPPSIQITAQGSNFQLGAGATLGLSVKSNGGADLASLAPNVPGGAPAAASAPAVSAAPAPTESSAPSTMAVAAAPPSANPGGQPDLKSTPIDFVAGEKTIFFDDFSDMDSDEPPPHWRVRGGAVDLRSGGGVNELYASKDVGLQSPKFVVPANFTFQMVWTGIGQMVWRFQDKDGNQLMWAQVRADDNGATAVAKVVNGSDDLGGDQISTDTSQPVEFDLWAQQGRVRAYLNGKRIEDANQVEFAQIASIEVDISAPIGIRSVRVAESAPDFSSAINSTGKYVTHGINFDTDSDVLKPDSAAVLKQVAAGLNKNPNLKLEIDGYTDSVGAPAHNIDLSKRRAQAVMSVLVSQFNIDPSRLTSNGFGAAKPTGSNDTPDGRASNRRVEFIKK
jgi:outer membrane protein OmpA-like peptidoglycan-associated protein